MGNILIVVYMCGICVFPCWLFKKRLEQVFGIALMFSVLAVYLSGFFGYMMECVYGLLGWAIISTIMVLWMSRKNLKQLFSRLITPGAIILAVSYLVMYVIFDGRLLYEWDEIAFWGPFTRETYRLGQFYNSVDSVVNVHMSYPPASTLFEYIFVRLLNHFHEPHLLLALHTLCLSMLLPCFGSTRLSDVHIWAPLGALAFLLPGVLFPSYMGNIYPDVLLGLCMAYAMYQALRLERDDMFGYISLAITTSFMLLIKDVGLLFALVVIGTVALKVCFFGGKFWHNPDVKLRPKALATGGVVLVVILPMVLYAMWSIRVADMGSQFDKADVFSIGEIMELVGGNAPEYRYNIMSSFGSRVFASPSSNAPVAFSYMGWMALLFAIMLVVITVRYKRGERKAAHWVNACMLAGGLLYALGMLLLYLFRFGEYSGEKLASYNRYMNTYMLAYLAFAFMSGIGLLIRNEQRQPYKRLVTMLPGLVALGLTLAFLLPTSFKDRVFMQEDLENDYLMTTRKKVAMQAEKLHPKVNKNEDKVYIVAQKTRGFEFHSLRFEMMPMQTNDNYQWSIGEPYPPDESGVQDIWTWSIGPEEFADILVEQQYDYVYLQRVDGHFTRQFKHLFADESQIYDGNLLHVVQTEEGVRLVTFGRLDDFWQQQDDTRQIDDANQQDDTQQAEETAPPEETLRVEDEQPPQGSPSQEDMLQQQNDLLLQEAGTQKQDGSPQPEAGQP